MNELNLVGKKEKENKGREKNEPIGPKNENGLLLLFFNPPFVISPDPLPAPLPPPFRL